MKLKKRALFLFTILVPTQALHAYTALTDLFSTLLQPHALVFDIGAHIGTKTTTYLEYGATVVCVEPQPQCQEYLQKKFYNQKESVYIEPYALADNKGTIELHICSQAPTISTCTQHWQQGRFSAYTWNKTITVETTTLDALVEKYGIPVLCKIDVEGFEAAVLTGLSQKIGCISFEWTHEFINQAKTCLDHLTNLGYTQFSFTYGENPTFVFKKPQPAHAILSKIQKDTNPLAWGDIYAFA